jgi:hypothetical protein
MSATQIPFSTVWDHLRFGVGFAEILDRHTYLSVPLDLDRPSGSFRRDN